MRTRLVALTAGLLLLGAGPAMADTGGQMADQTAGSRQFASSDATSTQRNPSNSNISVRIHSPGDNGSVSQTNSSSANSAAMNDNTTNQMLDQAGAGGQDGSQSAWNGQQAVSRGTSVQYNPSNEAVSVRIHSPGSDGDVSQANNSSASSTAHNTNATTQDLGQAQGGSLVRGGACCSSGSGVQAGSQDASNNQRADSSATSTQVGPSNENISVRIHSPGDNGSVSQTNSSSANSTATNDNTTDQVLHQSQAGSGCCSSGSGSGIQAASQDAWNGQVARSTGTSRQDSPSNQNDSSGIGGDSPKTTDGSIERLVPASGGDVTQSNDSSATSTAANTNATGQVLDQSQPGSGCCGRKPQVQAASQDAWNMQTAGSRATSTQFCPVNSNDGGGFGSLSQSNSSDASSEGRNTNDLMQRLGQMLGAVA